MKPFLKILPFLLIFFLLLYFCIWFSKPYEINIKSSVFQILLKKNINLDSKELKTHSYKNIESFLPVWKWFLIDEKGLFLTSKHILNQDIWLYFIKIWDRNYSFDLLNIHDDRDILVWRIKNFWSKDYIIPNFPKDLEVWERVFYIKDWERVYWEITGLDENIDDLKLKGLIKTNLKLGLWDSWTPLIRQDWSLIGINSAIDEYSWFSFAQKLDRDYFE